MVRREFTKKKVLLDVNEDVNLVDGYETDEKHDDEDVDRVDEMMEGIKDELGKRPRVLLTC